MKTVDESLRGGSDEPRNERERVARLAQLVAKSEIKADVVRLLLLGLQRKQIAHALEKSSHTVDGHMKEIYRELGIGDRAQLMLLANQLPITPVPFPESPESCSGVA